MVSLVLGSCTNVSCSSDGNSMLAWIVLSPSITPGQGRLVLQTQPAPVLGITRAAGHAALSWLVPSSDFTIEQTTDLSTPNWISVSNPMVLNFTNLQNQVTLPQPTGNAFYRLRH